VLREETERAAGLISIALAHHQARRILARVDAAAPHLDRAIDNLRDALRLQATALGVPAKAGLVDAMAAIEGASDELLRHLVGPSATLPGAEPAQRAEVWAGQAQREDPLTVTSAVAGHVHAAAGELLLVSGLSLAPTTSRAAPP
jgi:hypothetical protein